MSLYLKFVGALNGVTGSCTWLYHEPTDTQFLIDCGMYQDGLKSSQLNRREFPFNPKDLSFVLLTHAHVDHCGLIPRLYKEGFTGSIVAPELTLELTKLAIEDTANLDQDLFSKRDVKKIRYKAIEDKNSIIKLSDRIQFKTIRTAHILGSYGYEICWWNGEKKNSQTICFSGDIGNNTKTNPYQILLKPRQYPSSYCSYIVSESTYGSRTRDLKFESFENRICALGEIVLSAYQRSENPLIIIPAFSLNRTQEILADLYYLFAKHFPSRAEQPSEMPNITLDSLLANAYGKIFSSWLLKKKENKDEFKYLNELFLQRVGVDEPNLQKLLEALFNGERSHLAEFNPELNGLYIGRRSGKPKKKKWPQIVLTSSGMCEEGPVRSWLDEFLPDPETTVILTGYQAPYLLGGKLKEVSIKRGLGEKGPFSVEDTEHSQIVVKAHIEDMGPYYSGHASVDGLVDFLSSKVVDTEFRTIKRVFLNHGDMDAKTALKQRVTDTLKKSNDKRTIEAIEIPEPTSNWFNLTENQWCDSPLENHEETIETEMTNLRLITLMEEQNRLLKEILEAVKTSSGK